MGWQSLKVGRSHYDLGSRRVDLGLLGKVIKVRVPTRGCPESFLAAVPIQLAKDIRQAFKLSRYLHVQLFLSMRGRCECKVVGWIVMKDDGRREIIFYRVPSTIDMDGILVREKFTQVSLELRFQGYFAPSLSNIAKEVGYQVINEIAARNKEGNRS